VGGRGGEKEKEWTTRDPPECLNGTKQHVLYPKMQERMKERGKTHRQEKKGEGEWRRENEEIQISPSPSFPLFFETSGRQAQSKRERIHL
jgi:hypothetical protein